MYTPHIPNPHSTLEQHYGQDDAAMAFLTSLGTGVATRGAAELLADPAVEARLQEFQAECKVRAREGVKEWMQENYGRLLLGGIGLVSFNWVMLTIVAQQIARTSRSR